MIKKACCIVLFTILFLHPISIYASSQSSYQEYLIEFDSYRATLNEFKIARSEYLKFKTLTSQQSALEKTKRMLASRSQLLRSYLQFLNEKLNENASMDAINKNLYATLIQNEVKFLNNHTGLMSSISSLQDAESVSQQLSSHYTMLQSTIYQIIVGLKMAELTAIDTQYYELFTKTYSFIQTQKSSYTPNKQSTMERWLLQIQNKRDLYTQKRNDIIKENTTLKSASLTEIAASYQRIIKLLSEARQYLSEGTSFLQELTTSMQYGE